MEPFEPKGDGDFWKAPDRYINAIVDDESKFVRKKTLEIIFAEINSLHTEWKNCLSTREAGLGSGEGDSSAVSLEDQKHVQVMRLIRPLMKNICDPVERCRETAYDILSLVISLLNVEEQEEFLPCILPPLVERFGEEIVETSEEVRFTAVKFITILIETVEKRNLLPYVEDLTLIFSYLIVDPYHAVRITACKCCSYLAMKTKDVFHLSSDRLLNPLCKSLSHQQFRVRCAVIECIGDVVLFGNHKSAGDVLPHITQRLFDSSPNVRKLVIGVSANWLMNYVDRYSYFHKLLPILLTGLSDESPENSELAKLLWNKVGEKYLEENQDEYKDEADFPKPIDSVEGPYKLIERPSLGCRSLVWRNIGNILPGIVNDITDWALTTRIKCSQILYHLILHSEEKITMHMQKILRCLFLSVSDESHIVVDYVNKSAKLVGYFVPLPITLPVMMTGVTGATSVGPLKVLRSLVEGAKVAELESEAKWIGETLSDYDICQTLNADRQRVLVDTANRMAVRAPIAVGNLDEAGRHFFRVGLNILAMTKDPAIRMEALTLLNKIKELSKLDSVEHLIDILCKEILEEIRGSSAEWTSLSPNKLVFETILSYGGMILDHHSEIILNVMIENLGPNRDPEVRLRFFAMLAESLPHCQKAAAKETQLHQFVRHIIEDVLTPNLVWIAGKTAGALRTAASSCILAILNAEMLPTPTLLLMAPSLVPGLLSLLDDSTLLSRQIGCKALEKFVSSSSNSLPPDLVHQIYPVLLKRLDDVSNEVRLFACLGINALFSNLSADYDVDFYSLHLHAIISALIVHLDDDDHEIQDAVFRILLNLGKLQQSAVIETCQKFRLKHRTPDMCDKLQKQVSAQL